MYYIQCPKIGMVFHYASAQAFIACPVSGDWVFGLLSSMKMTEEGARKELIKVGKDIVRRMGDLDKLTSLRRDERVEARVKHVKSVIES